MKADTVQFKINIPPDVKAWIAAEAERNLRSQTAEIVFLLRQQMAIEGSTQK